MTDIVGIFETHCTALGWKFSYGNASNQNLLRSDKVDGEIYFLLDPVTRNIAGSEFGGDGEVTFNSSFLLVVKSNLDNVYHNQKEVDKTTGKYEKNIKPLLTELATFKSLVDCSDYEVEEWSIVDAINALDVNTDGLLVTFKIKTTAN